MKFGIRRNRLSRGGNRNIRRGARGSAKGRLIVALLVGGFAVVSYFMSGEVNDITGETQYISISPEQEIALGLQAAPSMMKQHGGLSRDSEDQRRVDRIGQDLVKNSIASETDWQFDFHVLADSKTVNAFALPGGQLFITEALLSKLKQDDLVAGVMAHEISHVIARHGAQQMAKSKLASGLTSAAVLASGEASTGQVAAMIGKMINMKYGRDDEIESDTLGVKIMAQAGYDPYAMIEVMKILAEAGGGKAPAEFFSTHPNPENRIEKIREQIGLLESN